MGNSLSADASRRGQRTTQKLSKPKTGNFNSAGLLSTTGISNSTRPSPGTRRLSLPQAPSSATTSPVISETAPAIPEVPANVSDDRKGLELGSRISKRLFRSNTFKEFSSRRKRSEGADVPSSQQERWSSRTSSLINGPEDGYNYNPTPIQGSLSVNVSRTSSHYDLRSYEAKRLLNLVEEPSYEDDSVVSGNHMYISESLHGDFRGRRPSIPETTPEITRANSEISLYTPMRRRSLMTPGIATREVPVDPGPSKPRVRHSLPSTPARRGSIESLDGEAAGFPPLSINPNLIPRALTPCEAEYKQTGAFKLGTLRITNGSPARSPARNPDENMEFRSPEQLLDGEPTDDYFEPKKFAPSSRVKTDFSSIAIGKVDVQNTDSFLTPSQKAPPDEAVFARSVEPQAFTEFPPGHQSGPLSHNDDNLKVPQIQVTSKNTAMEDELFDDEQEFTSVEILDVRVDTNAKSLPPRPRLTAEKKNSKEIIRTDSGIASPASEYSHVPLSKADSGYSSSISLRSFSSKPSAPEKERGSENEVEAVKNANMKQKESIGGLEVASSTTTAIADIFPKQLDEISPPPVPMKDPHLLAFVSPKGSGELSPSSQKSPKSPGTSKHNQAPERILSPNNIQIQANRNLKIHRASLHSPAMSNSSLRISTGIRKPGKFQRFLSGGRAPLATYRTHPTEYTSVPAISGDMQARLQTHTGSMPMSLRGLTLKSAASKETLGTILSVGSAELLQDDDVSPKNSGGQLWTSDRNQRTQISIGSTITHTTSVSTKKPIPRKPVPIRIKDSSLAEEFTKSPKVINKNSEENETVQTVSTSVTSGDVEIEGSSHIVTGNKRTRYSAPIPRLTGSKTTASHAEEDLGMTYTGTECGLELAQGKLHSLASLELPPAMPNIKSSKSPPPVSMRTRNMKSRRVSAPIRPQSTPPEMRWSGRPPYSRRGSQEGNGIAPEFTGTFASSHIGISRSYSQENFRTFDPAQYGEESSTLPTANHFRTMSLRLDIAKAQVPNWNVQADHGPTLSRPSSSDHSRRGSLASQSNPQSPATTDPSFFQRQQSLHPNPPLLHRRSSYDEYNLKAQDSCISDNGPYPSIPRNGRAFVSDPWSGRSMSMTQQGDQEWNQPVRHPPHAPRSHQRHRSLDQYGNPMPYRVLHSYNSPAYRNVPIWR